MLNPAIRTARRDLAANTQGRRQRGYTLVEALMATSVMAVLASAAVPSMKQMLVGRVADAQIATFTADLRFARAQALGRSRQVTLCALADTLDGGEPNCSRNGQDWSAGWVVFVDGGERGRLDDGDVVLRVHQRPASAGPVTAPQRSISFQLNGLSAMANATVRFSPRGVPASDTSAAGSKVVCINKAGKARVAEGARCSG